MTGTVDLVERETDVESLRSRVRVAEGQRDMLMTAIRDAVIKAGLIRADVGPLSGPECLMFVSDLAEAHLATVSALEETQTAQIAPAPSIPTP